MFLVIWDLQLLRVKCVTAETCLEQWIVRRPVPLAFSIAKNRVDYCHSSNWFWKEVQNKQRFVPGNFESKFTLSPESHRVVLCIQNLPGEDPDPPSINPVRNFKNVQATPLFQWLVVCFTVLGMSVVFSTHYSWGFLTVRSTQKPSTQYAKILVFCVFLCCSVRLFLYGPCCYGAFKLDMSTFTQTGIGRCSVFANHIKY